MCGIGTCHGKLTLAAKPGVTGDQEFSRSDSSFQAAEQHETTRVKDGDKRAGWAEHRDTVRFGAYSLVVTQRIDPASGFPPPARTWGDAFVGIGGKRPAFYMASNWSPWDFLSARIRLAGEDKDIPSPTSHGRLAYCGLREQTPQRIVADAVWQDVRGGFLRARMTGWRGKDRFGLSLRYTPPAGKAVASVIYRLVCQPYDFSDRGYWQRRRWVQTAARDAALGKEPLAFDPASEWQFVFHNRNAQNTAGCVLGVHRPGVRSLAVAGKQPIRIDVTPAALDGEVVLVLGDWVDEPYALVAARFFTDAKAVGDELAATAAQRVAKPARPLAAEGAVIDKLLAACPELAAAFANRLRAARARTASVWAAIDAVGGRELPPATLKAAGEARRELEDIHREIRGAWVKMKLFALPVPPENSVRPVLQGLTALAIARRWW